MQGSLAAAMSHAVPAGSAASATLGTVHRGAEGLTVAWRHDVLDDASPAGNLPMERMARCCSTGLAALGLPHMLVAGCLSITS